jgi:hypothetical protein
MWLRGSRASRDLEKTYNFTHVDGELILDLEMVSGSLKHSWKSKRLSGYCVDLGKLWAGSGEEHFASR